MKQKKGESQYLSWILIFGMIVAISYLLYNWSIDQARKTTEQLEKSTDPLVCSEISISVEGICQTSNTLEINLTNINIMEIEGLVIKTVGLYPEDEDYLDTITVANKLSPGESEEISVLKQGTLSNVELTPYVKKGNKNVYCEDKSVKKEKNELKQC